MELVEPFRDEERSSQRRSLFVEQMSSGKQPNQSKHDHLLMYQKTRGGSALIHINLCKSKPSYLLLKQPNRLINQFNGAL